MLVDVVNFRSKPLELASAGQASGRLRRAIARLPVIGAGCRGLKRLFNRALRLHTRLGQLRFLPLSESDQIVLLRRQMDELRAQLRATQPLFDDYQVACRRVVELENQLLRADEFPGVREAAKQM